MAKGIPVSNTIMPKSFFRKTSGTKSVSIGGFTCELNTAAFDTEINDNQFSGGQNVIPASITSFKKRGGVELYSFMGSGPILGGGHFTFSDGSEITLVAYGTQIWYDTGGGAFSPITGCTITANLPIDMTHFFFNDKIYIVNGTDNVCKISRGSYAGDQTDASFKKGKYIANYQGRIIVAYENVIWYSDFQADTFSNANNYITVQEPITGLFNLNDIKLIITTKHEIYSLQNFLFDGTTSWMSDLYRVPSSFGTLYERTISAVNGYIYLLGQEDEKVAAIYQCDGYNVVPISDLKIINTMATLNGSYLQNACSIDDGGQYYLCVTENGQTTNTMTLVYDTVKTIFLPPQRKSIPGAADYSCLWKAAVNGVSTIFAGCQTNGNIYQLNANDGMYDELSEENFLVNGTLNVPLNSNPATRGAQSFQLHNYNNTQTVYITKVAAQLAYVSGTATDLTLRIETDNNGNPSGTLVNSSASGTISALSATAFAWYNVTFFSPIQLNGNITYWLVIEYVTEGSGNSMCNWLSNNSSASYAYGSLNTYQSVTTSTQHSVQPQANPGTTTMDGYAEAVIMNDTNASLFSDLRSLTPTSSYYTSDQSSITTSISDSYAIAQLNMVEAGYISGQPANGVMDRTIMLFDTSFIPSGAVIDTANVQIYCYLVKNNYFPGSSGMANAAIGLTSFSPISNTSLVNTDYSLSEYGSTRLTSDILTSNLTINSYDTYSLNAAGLSNIIIGGISKFALRTNFDIDGVDPSQTYAMPIELAAYIQTAENTYPPILTINYTVATGTPAWTPVTAADTTFIIFQEEPIIAYADTKTWLPNDGMPFQLRRFQALFANPSNNVPINISFYNGLYGNQLNFPYNPGLIGGSNWDAFSWGDGTQWGGAALYSLQWIPVDYFINNILKLRIGNTNVNQQFEFSKVALVLSPKLRNNN